MRLLRVSALALVVSLVAAACGEFGNSLESVADAAASQLEGDRVGLDCTDAYIDPMPYVNEDRNSEVRMSEEGPIVAREEFRVVRITINREKRIIEVLGGYEGDAISGLTRTYANDHHSYWEFVAALDFEGFTRCRGRRENVSEGGAGTCPQDGRTIVELFEMVEADEDPVEVSSLWAAACDSRLGTLDGDPEAIRELFHAQIPDYDDLAEEAGF